MKKAIRESAGTGRQARLRGVCQPTWEFKSPLSHQISCLICLPDKSGNFLAFRAKIAQNTVKSTKTGSAVVDLTAAEPVFLIFRAKIPRTFWGKCTKQSSRKKAAVG